MLSNLMVLFCALANFFTPIAWAADFPPEKSKALRKIEAEDYFFDSSSIEELNKKLSAGDYGFPLSQIATPPLRFDPVMFTIAANIESTYHFLDHINDWQ